MDPCKEIINKEEISDSLQQLCANGCGFYGTKANNNLCSKCFLEEKKEEETKTNINVLSSRKDYNNKEAASAICSDEKKMKKVMCSCCNKRIRQLMIFGCRCGGKFCMKHRFPEDHSCTFDFKDVGDRLVLAMDNLLIKAEKLHHRI